jgi:hypothetical protein
VVRESARIIPFLADRHEFPKGIGEPGPSSANDRSVYARRETIVPPTFVLPEAPRVTIVFTYP